MKSLFLFVFLFLTYPAISQVTFRVDHFSDHYYGRLFIKDTSEVFSKGWVAIYDKKTNQQLIKINSDELTFILYDGQVLANIRELPYGEQSQIIYGDVNFDGLKDFALMDGQNSCYHGPSYQVYLASGKGFKQSPEFTRLAQEYCGFFNVDPKLKQISTMTKSGCCWHQFSTFKVKDNKPYPIRILEEEMSPSGITWDYAEEKLVNGRMVRKEYQMLALEPIAENTLLKLTFENKKMLQLFHEENILYYVLSDSEGRIELIYSGDFTYDEKDDALVFVNGKTQYRVYRDKVVIFAAGNPIVLKATSVSNTAVFSGIKLLKLGNLKIEP